MDYFLATVGLLSFDCPKSLYTLQVVSGHPILRELFSPIQQLGLRQRNHSVVLRQNISVNLSLRCSEFFAFINPLGGRTL